MLETQSILVNLDGSKSLFAPQERLLHLDGLRGLAVLLVFFVHLHPLFSGLLEPSSILYSFSHLMASIGNAGVDLFFLLSGYLIYGVVLKQSPTYWSFLYRRVRRIYPTFIAVSVLYLILGSVFPHENKLAGSTAEKARYIAANAFLLPGIFPIRPIITVAWSLSYEFLFYLSIPLIMRISFVPKMSSGQRAALFAVWWVLGCIVLRFLGLQRLQMFAVGILIYELSQVREFTKRLNARGECLGAFGLICGLGSSYFLFVPTSELITTRSFGRYFAFPVMSASLFLFGTYALLYSGMVRHFLSLTVLRSLGRISYSYYLIHGLTLKALALMVIVAKVRMTGTAIFCVVCISGFALTCLTGTLLYWLVEQPLSLQTESTLSGWWHRRRAASEYRVAARANSALASNSGTTASHQRAQINQIGS